MRHSRAATAVVKEPACSDDGPSPSPLSPSWWDPCSRPVVPPARRGHPSSRSPSCHAELQPGRPDAPGGAATGGLRHADQSTNWSGYAVTGANGVNYSNTVRPGDHFTASVTFSGTQTYTLKISDTTRGWSHTTTKSEAGLSRSSAEVITGAPSSSSYVLPLANFGTVNYSASAANGTSLGSQAPTQIVMVNSCRRRAMP
ncbi:MAG: G1 family glutamic endopeptidase [Actinomycetota bacterium]